MAETDMEIQRIDDEIRKIDEKKKRLVERRLRRQRQIREKQLRDKDAWMRKLIPLLDKTLQERYGQLYWYGLESEAVCRMMGGTDGVVPDPEKEKEDPASEEKEDPNEDKGRDERRR